MSNRITMWYKIGLNKYLSELGFKHFATGEGVEHDFDEGRAFFVDLDNKEFGLKDMTLRDDISAASAISEEFVITGKIGRGECL